MMVAKTLVCAVLLSGLSAFSFSSVAHAEPGSAVSYTEEAVVQAGKASWYGPGFHGRFTANGERFNTHAMTAAHKTLPFGTRVKVINARTGRSVVVRINDRGPYAHGRVIDLSKASARAIGVSGVAEVMLGRL